MGSDDIHQHNEPQREPLPEEGQKAQAAAEPIVEADKAGSEALSDALRVSFRYLKWAMVGLVVVYVATGIFWVDPQEVKFKLRFGGVVRSLSLLPPRPARDLVLGPGTGVYLRWPWEETVVLRTDEQTLELRREFWPNIVEGSDVRGQRGLNVRTDGYLITGDVNVVHMRLRVRYRVRNDADGALAYKLQMADPELILKRALMASTMKVVGSMDVMQVIKRVSLFDQIEAEVRQRLADFERKVGCPLGIDHQIRVEAIEMENVKNPTEPAKVREAFNLAQMAESLKDQLRREGDAEESKILSAAQAQATRIRAEAAAEAVGLVRSAKADAEAMQQVAAIYRQSKAVAKVFRTRYFQRVMEQVMLRSPGAFILYEPPDGSERELRLMHQKRAVDRGQGGTGS